MRRRVLFFALLLLGACLSLLAGCRSSEAESEQEAAWAPATDVRPAWVREAVIYEVFVRNFTEEGTFQAVIPRLGELDSLGVTTLWLMPIHPVGQERHNGTLGSPYAIQDYFAVNPRFGSEEDFQALVDSVHARDMHLIIDLVANHTAWDNAWLEEHPDWYTRDSTGAIAHPGATDWTDVADLNYDNPAVWEKMKEAMTYWVREFDIDGYRCDVAEMMPLDFWKEAIAELHAIKPVMMLAEGEDPALHEVGFDITYSWKLYGAKKKVWRGAPVDTLVAVLREQQQTFPEDALRLRFTTNHDETAWDAPPVELFGGTDGAEAAAVLTATLPGVPLLYNGQEVGGALKLPLFEKVSIDWSAHPEMRTFYTELLHLHNRSDVLQEGALEMLEASTGDVVAFARAKDDARLFVGVNSREHEAPLPVPAALRGATFTDALTGERTTADTLQFSPYGYKILEVSGAAPSQ